MRAELQSTGSRKWPARPSQTRPRVLGSTPRRTTRRRFLAVLGSAVMSNSCSKRAEQSESKITVAAAANLTGVIEQLAIGFRKQTGVEVVPIYSSTAQLAQQIEHGAPFDVFAAADTEHVDQLIAKRLI